MIFRTKDKTQWHRWFAWYPVEVEWCEWAWLQVVERHKTLLPSGRYDYRNIWNKEIEFEGNE